MKTHELDNYSDRLHPSNISNWQSLVDLEPDPNSSFTDEDSWGDWDDGAANESLYYLNSGFYSKAERE